METITLFLVCAGIGGLILQYWKNEPAFNLLTEILAVGGLVSAMDEYGASTMAETPALVLVIAMVSIMIWSAWNFVRAYTPSNKRR